MWSSHYKTFGIAGCRVCKQPLEPMEKINKINTRKPEKRPREFPREHYPEEPQEKKPEPRPEHLDPHPMTTRCGHIFHLGCVKKLISEKASCRVDCPTCGKPVVLAQLRSIKFFYPRNCDSMSNKIHKMNQENNVLTSELAEVKKIKAHKKYEHEVISAKAKEIKQKAQKREVEYKVKAQELTNLRIDGLTYPEINHNLERTKDRILEMSVKNSNILRHLENIVSQLNTEGSRSIHLQCLKEINDCMERQNFTRIEHDTRHAHRIVASRHQFTAVGMDGKLNSIPIPDTSWASPVRERVPCIYINKVDIEQQEENTFREERPQYFQHHNYDKDNRAPSNRIKETEKNIHDSMTPSSFLKQSFQKVPMQSKDFKHYADYTSSGDSNFIHHSSMKISTKKTQLSKSCRRKNRYVKKNNDHNCNHPESKNGLNCGNESDDNKDAYFSVETESTDNVSFSKMVLLPPGLLGDYQPPMVNEETLKITRERRRRERRGRIKLASRGMKKYRRY